MYVQSNLFLDTTALKNKGIKQAVNHANQVIPDWSEKAYLFFLEWLDGKPSGFKFQIEEFREVAFSMGMPKPPSLRAFGSITLRAKNAGHIVSIGIKSTKGKTAHHANACVWVKTLN